MADPQQDWFAQNAPAASAAPPQQDWFAQNAPGSPRAEDTRNVLQKFRDWITSGETAQQAKASYEQKHGKLEMPGSFEGHPENTAGYVETGPGEVVRGTADIAQGNIARGAHRVISGVGTTMTPMAPILAAAAPLPTAVAIAGGTAGSKIAQTGAEAAGATPDQAALAGDIGGIAGGYGVSKIPLRTLATRGVLLGKTPEEAYESALKPSTTLSQGERASIVNTGLQEGIPVTKGGLQKISDRIDDLNSAIDATIKTRPNAPIDTNSVAARTSTLRAKFANQVNPNADMAAIEASKQEFLANHGATPAVPPKPTGLLDQYGKPIMDAGTPAKPAQPLTAIAAQEMKKGTYQMLGDKAYGELSSAAVEAQKALARGIKEELVTQFPEISKLNAQESQLLDLQPILERAVARIGNHQIMGIGTPIAAGAGKALTGSNKAGLAIGLVKAVLDDPAVKSRLAIAISKSGIAPAAAFQRVNLYSSQLAAAGLRYAGGSDDNREQSPSQ